MRINVIFTGLIVLFIYGCTGNSKTIEDLNKRLQEKEKEIDQLQTKYDATQEGYDTLSQSYENLKNENATLQKDIEKGIDLIDQIEKNLDFITKLERPLVNPVDIEKKTKQYNIFSNIKLIQQYIKNTNLLINQLMDSTRAIPHFEDYINELLGKLEKKDSILKDLKSQVSNLETDLDNASAKIREQEKQIEELNKKFIIFVSKKESVIIEADRSNISLPFKFNMKDILTDHPASSFTIRQVKGSGYMLEIYNEENFWKEGNYMIIKVNRRHLMSMQ